MKTRRIALLLLVVAAACGDAKPATPPVQAQIRLDPDDAGRTVVVRKDAVLVVTLPANLGTGYSWQSVANNLVRLDASLLGGTGNAPGTQQDQVFRYTAVKTGRTTLVLLYRQPWNNQPPQQRFEVVLDIVD